MEERVSSVHKATMALIGTIIGAGVFALPAMFSTVGFWPGSLLFFIVAVILLATHLTFAEIILAFKQRMRVAGYANAILGRWGFVLASCTYVGQIVGVNFIYIVLGGSFLASLAPIFGLLAPLIFWQILFWFVMVAVVARGLKFLASVEAWSTWVLIFVMILAIALAMRTWDISIVGRSHWDLFFVPFGIFLFALSGLSVIGEVVDIAKRRRYDTRLAVILGTVIAAGLSWIFGVSLYFGARGHVGRNPTDLIQALPGVWSWVIPVFGLFAIITSYLTTAEDLEELFHLDFHLHRTIAWALSAFLPLILLMVSGDFLLLVDFIGTVFGGITGILVVYMAIRLFAPRSRIAKHPLRFLGSFILLLAFAVGILHKFLYKPLL